MKRASPRISATFFDLDRAEIGPADALRGMRQIRDFAWRARHASVAAPTRSTLPHRPSDRSPKGGSQHELTPRPESNLTARNCHLRLMALERGLITYVLAQRPPRLLTRTFDDACYYLKIASNAAQGLGLTFDGTAPTNGFQPLWLYILVPFIRFLDGSPERIFKLTLVVQVVILAGAAMLR